MLVTKLAGTEENCSVCTSTFFWRGQTSLSLSLSLSLGTCKQLKDRSRIWQVQSVQQLEGTALDQPDIFDILLGVKIARAH